MKSMIRVMLLVFAAAAVSLTAASHSYAAYDVFLKIDGIPGESTDNRHKDEIELLSFSWGIARPASTTGGGGAGQRQHKPIVITKPIDKSTPKLMEACATGKHIKEAVLSLTKRGARSPYLVVEFKDVLVTSVQVGSHAPDENPRTLASASGNPKADTVPTESISFNYEEIKMTYVVLHPSGAVQEVVIFDSSPQRTEYVD